ncbi:MAG TPA: sigma 54-interacting transcriptional regulator [Acidobacteriaceae bacterium]|nr:sigma 54-interacting transcriptional regulator [Acidobacteriaceae bacterium]
MQMHEPPISGHGFLSVSFLWVDKLREQRSDVNCQDGESSDLAGQELKPEELWKKKVAFLGEVYHQWSLEEILGPSKELRQAIADVETLTQTNHTILITGEKGVAMELVARSIEASSRSLPQACTLVHCAAIPASMTAAELFGQLEDSHFQAEQPRLGGFPLVDGRTLLLDGIESLSTAVQIELLHALEEMDSVSGRGSDESTNFVRVIALAEGDLSAAVEAGSFNSDLFLRLNRFSIRIPPLRERSDDIPMLVQSFLDSYARATGKSRQSISNSAMELLQSYPWPGNLRELEHVLERFLMHKEMGSFLVDAMSTRQKTMTARTWVRSIAVAQEIDDYQLLESALLEAIAAFSDRISETPRS